MHRFSVHSAALVFATVVGCAPTHYAGSITHGSLDDTGAPLAPDAGPVPGRDAAVIPEDAWNPPGHDAAVTPHDAWAASTPDAWTMPTCPTYAGDVRALYTRHCASCHTTGSDPRFGSSYTVANQTTSSCGGGVTMAACTIQLGRPGGSMARRDSLGGFNTTEIATIQSWIDCGRPM